MLLTHNMRVFCALLQRDMLLLKRSIGSKLIDGAFMCFIIVVATGYLLPALGMSTDMIGPMFVNIFFNIFFMFGFSMSINFANEIKHKGRIFYLATLPTHRFWIIASYVANFIIESTIIVLPLLIVGLFFLQDSITFITPNPLMFTLVYFASTIFFGLFMLLMSIHYSYDWFLDNIWPRRLSPMFSFGATFFLWKQTYAVAPPLALLALLNPLVYICEGLRSGFIGGNAFINGWYCLVALILLSLITAITLNSSIKKRLDPVC